MILMTNKILFTILMVMFIPVISGSAQEAHAASLLINDSVEGEITINHGRFFEFGVVNNGVPYAGYVAGSETVSGETGDFTATCIVTDADDDFDSASIVISTTTTPTEEPDKVEICHKPGTKAEKTMTIPEWIKNNAAWWASGEIDDEAFVAGIQYLIKKGVITV